MPGPQTQTRQGRTWCAHSTQAAHGEAYAPASVGGNRAKGHPARAHEEANAVRRHTAICNHETLETTCASTGRGTGIPSAGQPCAERPQRSAGLLQGRPEMPMSRGRPGLRRHRSRGQFPWWAPRHADTAEGNGEACSTVILLRCQGGRRDSCPRVPRGWAGPRRELERLGPRARHTLAHKTLFERRGSVVELVRDTPPSSASHGACLLTTGTGRPAPEAQGPGGSAWRMAHWPTEARLLPGRPPAGPPFSHNPL